MKKSVSLFSSLDPILLESMQLNIYLSNPHALLIRFDFDSEQQVLAKRISTEAKPLTHDAVSTSSCCPNCSLREAIVETLAYYRSKESQLIWQDAFVFLPAGFESFQIAHALANNATISPESNTELGELNVRAVGTLINGLNFTADMLSIDSLAERNLAFSFDDERSVGEFLSHEIQTCNLIVCDPKEPELLRHLANPTASTVLGLHQVDLTHLETIIYDADAIWEQISPRNAKVNVNTNDQAEAWSIELTSKKPLHPEKFHRRIEEFSLNSVNLKGIFWLPNRPDEICEIQGAGGQLWLGCLGSWENEERLTKIVATGVGEANRIELQSLFKETLISDQQLANGGLDWLGKEDILAPWLGV